MATQRIDEIDSEFGRTLRRARLARGKSQTALAQDVTASLAQIHRWETGVSSPPASMAKRLAEILSDEPLTRLVTTILREALGAATGAPAAPLSLRVAFTAGPAGTLLVSNSSDARAIRAHLQRLLDWLDHDPRALEYCRVVPDGPAPRDVIET